MSTTLLLPFKLTLDLLLFCYTEAPETFWIIVFFLICLMGSCPFGWICFPVLGSVDGLTEVSKALAAVFSTLTTSIASFPITFAGPAKGEVATGEGSFGVPVMLPSLGEPTVGAGIT